MKKILIVVLQIIGAFGVGIIIPYSLGIGNGLELIVIPIATGLGIWLPAYFLEKIHWKYLLGAILGGFIGMFLINNVIPPMGFTGVLLPIVGSFIGFYYLKFI